MSAKKHPFPRQHPDCIAAREKWAAVRSKRGELQQTLSDARNVTAKDKEHAVVTAAQALLVLQL